MTNTEKFILKEKGAKEIVMSIVSVFDGKSYKFANAALNAAKTFLNEDSTFTASTALKKIAALSDTPAPEIPAKKTVNDLEGGKKILDAVKDAVKNKEFLTAILKGAKVKKYVEDKMTLNFENVIRAKNFEKFYKKKFEESASKIFGRKITVEVEGV